MPQNSSNPLGLLGTSLLGLFGLLRLLSTSFLGLLSASFGLISSSPCLGAKLSLLSLGLGNDCMTTLRHLIGSSVGVDVDVSERATNHRDGSCRKKKAEKD